MKTPRDLIREIEINSANLHHIASDGRINGSFMIDLERKFEEYAAQFQPKWIKGLPPDDLGPCILNTLDQGVVPSDTVFMEEHRKEWMQNVTHYFPLPQPPKE